jgi:hypothetical protein
MAAPKHGVAWRSRAFLMTLTPDHLDELLDRCEQLSGWARAHGFALSDVSRVHAGGCGRMGTK